MRLAIYPAILLNIQTVGSLPLPDSLWHPITVFLLFSTFVVSGNCLANFLPRPGPGKYWMAVVPQLLFFPFFMFCNYLPGQRHPLPVLISNDYIYLVGSMIFSFLSGHLSSLALMFAPKYVSWFLKLTLQMSMNFISDSMQGFIQAPNPRKFWKRKNKNFIFSVSSLIHLR